MSFERRSLPRFRPSLSLVLFCVFLLVLWMAGGASRADVAGQVVVRAAAWILLIVAIATGRCSIPAYGRPVWVWLALIALVPLLQLVPLSPGVWQMLPGRKPFLEAAAAIGESQPWRPLSMVPGATVNAISSLIVPALVLLLATNLRADERKLVPGIVLATIFLSLILGMLQFTGMDAGSPFVNRTTGDVSGTFANRNHFALFLALGCVVAPVWAFGDERRLGWRSAIAGGLVLFFELTILASGSRAGLILGGLAIVIGVLLVGRDMRKALRRYPRWLPYAIVAGLAGVLIVFVSLSIAADRAVSINRAFSEAVDQDMRHRGLPVVWGMVRDYFPFGSGLGGFAAMFRIYEPFYLLKPTYFNHAHNDFLEILVDTGLTGLALLVAAAMWWIAASVKAWKAGGGPRQLRARLGSAVLLLIFIASVFDYPARTPIIMAMAAVAVMWLSDGGRSTLRGKGEDL